MNCIWHTDIVARSNTANKKQLLRLCCQVLEHKQLLQHLLQCDAGKRLLLEDAYQNDYVFIQVLLHEALLSKYGLRCSQQYALPLRAKLYELREEMELYQSTAPAASDQSGGEATSSAGALVLPRYARVNGLLSSRQQVHDWLTQHDYSEAECKQDTPKWKRYRRLVTGLEAGQFVWDAHIPDLLVFAPGTDLHACELVTAGHVMLQDKASCLPVLCLAPVPGAHVLDACAAPGIKSFHLADCMHNKGRIQAFDRSADRMKVMRQLLARSGARIVQLNTQDFLKTQLTTDKTFAKVEFALVDPPCSGSGIVSRRDAVTDEEFVGNSEKRIKSLSNLQAMMLKHALRLPALKRLVYSTCSVEVAENEQVIAEVLSDESISARFELANALPEWTVRGADGFDFSPLLIRAEPNKTLTNGFFVAVFERKS